MDVKPKKILKKIRVLIVDDSLVFRRFLGDVFQDYEFIEIVGEAQNGIEALDLMLKTNPDVILLDMEMPLMDGMTALQHLMIHRPLPVIMFSSLTEEGTPRCFDALKNGAVDFVCKDFIFQQSNQLNHKKLLLEKVQRAARLKLKSREPITSSPSTTVNDPEVEQRVVFCEECGNREVVTVTSHMPAKQVNCSKCGDSIELIISAQSQYRRNNFIVVLGGGEGSFVNLLQIVPYLPADMNGTIFVVIHQSSEHVTSFTEYLDAISPMRVVRAREGLHIEGGNCYIASGHDYLIIKPYSAQLTLQKVQKGSLRGGPLDILFASVSTVFKKRAAGIVLSGEAPEGDKGMAILIKYGGNPAIIAESECFNGTMAEHVSKNCNVLMAMDSEKIIDTVVKMHNQAKHDGTAG